MLECVVKGSEILAKEYTNPTFLTLILAPVFVTVPLLVVGPRVIRGWRRWFTPLIIGALVAVYALQAAIVLSLVSPHTSYGVKVTDGTVTVTFIGSDTVSINACNITGVKLVSFDDALRLLERRDFGIGDPFSKVFMGYFTSVNGSKAYVVMVDGSKAMVFEYDGKLVIVAVPDVERCYHAILEATSGCRG